MKTTTMITSTLLCVLVALGSPSALAQDDEIGERVRQLLAEARTHYDGGRKALAAQTYLELYELLREAGNERAPIALWNAGNSLTDVPGRESDAIETLRRFLDESTTLTDDPDVRDWRSEAVSLIDELEARREPTDSEDEPPPERQDQDANSDQVPEPSPGSGSISPVGPVLLGVGAATLAVGAVFGALALVRESNLMDRCGGTRCPNTEENHASYDEMRLFAAASDVLLVAGGVVAVTGLVLTLTLEGDADTETRASARLGPSFAGLALEGSF